MNGIVGSRFIFAVRKRRRDVWARGDWRRKNGIVDDRRRYGCHIWKVWLGVINDFDEMM